jgi:hypothetical protein
MQRSATSPGPVGLRITHGLVGSAEWWSQIQSEALPLQAERGVVSGYWPGQHGGGPAEFELRQPNGVTSHWHCELDPGQAGRRFLPGHPVEVQYVIQELKEAFNGSHATKVTVSISLG